MPLPPTVDPTVRHTLGEQGLFAAAIANLSVGVTISDATLPDNPLIFANPGFARLTGYSVEEAVGKNCRYLQGPGTDPDTVKRIHAALESQVSITTVLLNYRKDGTPFWNELTINPIANAAGIVSHFIGIQVDVTARVQAQLDLLASERRFRTVWEQATDAMVLSDAAGTVQMVNDAYCQLYGLTKEAMVGQHFACIFPEEQRTQAIAAYHVVFREGRSGQRFEAQVQRGNGEQLAVESRVDYLEEHGQRVAMLSVVRDITERKRLEEILRELNSDLEVRVAERTMALAAANQQLRTNEALLTHQANRAAVLAEISQALAAITLDYKGVIDLAVRRIADLFGGLCVVRLLSEDKSYLHMAAVHHPDPLHEALVRQMYGQRPQPAQQGLMGRVIQTGIPILYTASGEQSVREAVAPVYWEYLERANIVSLMAVPLRAQGNTLGVIALNCDASARPYTDDDKNFLLELADRVALAVINARLFEAVQQELHERTRTEAALRESQHFIQRVTAMSPALIFVYDLARQTNIYTNQQGPDLLGYSPAQVQEMGRHLSLRLCHPDDFAQFPDHLALVQHLPDGEIATYEGRMRHSNGSWRWLSVRESVFSRTETGAPLHILAVAIDVSEQRASEEARLELERRLWEGQKLESLGVLAGGIAHDFNNMLTGIIGNASLALHDLPPGAENRPLLEQIDQIANQAAILTQQMLAYSGRGHFVVAPLSLNPLISETVGLLRLSIPSRVALHTRLDHDLPQIEADVSQLRQLLMNCIINGAEALGDTAGSVTVTTGVRRVETEADDLPAGSYVLVRISDTGCGMDESTRARMFEPFFSTKFTGRGLGLSAVQGIVRGHRGHIEVESNPGTGTVITVLLPALATTTIAAAPAAPDQHAPTVPSLYSGTVLVVDDDGTVRMLVRRMLQKMGFVVLEAVNGVEGMHMFETHQSEIVAVLMDLIMPEADGDVALRRIRGLNPSVPVVIMSGYRPEEIGPRFAGYEQLAFLYKPFRPHELRAHLSRLMEAPA